MALNLFLKIKPSVIQCLDILTLLYAMQNWTDSQELQEKIKIIATEIQSLLADITEFSKRCSLDPENTRILMDDLKALLTSWKVLITQKSEKDELLTFPSFVSCFFLKVQLLYEKLNQQLLENEKPLISEGRGNVFVNSSSEFSVNVNSGSAANPFVGPPVARAAVKTNPSEETAFPSPESTTSAGSFPEDSSPAYVLRLPHWLELKLTAAEKELFIRVLEFISAARDKGDKSLYDLDKIKERMYVALVAGLDVILRKYIGKDRNPGREMALLFGGNEDEARKYISAYHNSDSTLSDTYLLQGNYPELEEQVKALIKQ